MIQAAKDAVAKIDINELRLLKTYQNPPKSVVYVLNCVLIMKPINIGNNDISWSASKLMLQKTTELIEGLKGFAG